MDRWREGRRRARFETEFTSLNVVVKSVNVTKASMYVRSVD